MKHHEPNFVRDGNKIIDKTVTVSDDGSHVKVCRSINAAKKRSRELQLGETGGFLGPGFVRRA